MSHSYNSIEEVLKAVKSNQLSINDAKAQLSHYDELGFAKLTYIEHSVKDFEVIFGQGKTKEQITKIISSLIFHNEVILVTRVDEMKAKYILQHYPNLEYHQTAQLISTPLKDIPQSKYYVSVLCAGTSDLPIAEEAALTAEIMGVSVKRFYDVGVSGIHRLLSNIHDIRKGKVSIVIAGMEGALASVVGGLVNHPVYAVPTSVGYGANLNGVTTLLSMINSCAPGTSVLNINNGFGGGYNAAQIIHMLENKESEVSL